MNPEKWKKLMEMSSPITTPLMHLYRAHATHPWRVYAFYLAFCVAGFASIYNDLKKSGVCLWAFIFVVGFGPVFFFFTMKVMTWMMLRGQGIPADLLRKD
jgi:hypothetical protein